MTSSNQNWKFFVFTCAEGVRRRAWRHRDFLKEMCEKNVIPDSEVSGSCSIFTWKDFDSYPCFTRPPQTIANHYFLKISRRKGSTKITGFEQPNWREVHSYPSIHLFFKIKGGPRAHRKVFTPLNTSFLLSSLRQIEIDTLHWATCEKVLTFESHQTLLLLQGVANGLLFGTFYAHKIYSR